MRSEWGSKYHRKPLEERIIRRRVRRGKGEGKVEKGESKERVS